MPISSAGVSLGRREEKMGIKASSTCDIILNDVRVPRNNVIGNLGEGFSIAMAQLQLARIGVAAQALGIGQAALDLAVNYANQRNMFGKQLIDLQLVKVVSFPFYLAKKSYASGLDRKLTFVLLCSNSGKNCQNGCGS